MSASKNKVGSPEEISVKGRTNNPITCHPVLRGKRKISSWKIGYEVASVRGDGGAFYFTDNALMRAAEALAPVSAMRAN